MFSDWHNWKNRFYCGLVVFPSLSLLNSISGNCCELGWLLEEFSTSLSSGTPGLGANIPVHVSFFLSMNVSRLWLPLLSTVTSWASNAVSIFDSCCGCTHTFHLCKGSASRTSALWPDRPVPGSYWLAPILDNNDAILLVQLQEQQNASHQHFYQLCEVSGNRQRLTTTLFVNPNFSEHQMKWRNYNPL